MGKGVAQWLRCATPLGQDEAMTIVLVLFTVLSVATYARLAIGLRTELARVDDVTRYERRFDDIRDHLPARGTVGYHADNNASAEYYLTQYTLAPIIVAHTSDHPLVVGNYYYEIIHPEGTGNATFRILRELESGVILYHRDVT
jgi:hypothetical protein